MTVPSAMVVERPDQREALVEFQVLGPVGLRANGRRVELGSDKERTLLGLLALDVGRPVALGVLMDRLWDGEPPPHARENAHSYVSRLRRRLRLADPSSAGAPRIVSRAHTYTLEAARESVDWHRFQQLVARAGAVAADGDDERTAALLDRAEGLWRGEALAGLPGLWAETTRRMLAERRLGAAVSRIAASLRLGRYAEVTAEVSALVDRYPGDETLAGQLMLAYYGGDRYTDALRVHQETRRLLMTQYGSRPGAELDRVHRGILDRVPAADLVRGRGATPRPAAAAPPARPRPPRNLPHQPPLIGRRAELRALSAAVDAATEHDRVISLESVSTVSGMAGVGKTTVAVHGAHRLAERFPDAQLYVDLRGHSPVGEPLGPGAALATLLRLLGTPAETIPVELEGRTALWQTMLAERRAVIVLDDAVSADQIRPLLPSGSPSLTIITSRRRLTGLPQARHIPLDVLPTDDAIALFRACAGEERTLDIREITRIIRLCGHLPLAIELVGSRFRAHPAWTLDTLADRLTRAEGRLGEIRDAEQELLRAFDLTYRTLTPEQRAAFRRLSLHSGPDVTVDSAAASLDLRPAAAERVLESLLACHLLREPTPDRYRFHDLLREYGHSRSLADDTEEDRAGVLRRLTDFHVDAADRADRLAYPRRTRPAPPRERGPGARLPDWPDAGAARSWLAAERANLLATERRARGQGRPGAAARLAYAMAGFLDEECHWLDAEAVLETAVEHWTRTGEQAALCRALLHLSAVHAHTARYPEAAESGGRALRIARATGDEEAEAEVLRTLGTLNWHVGDHQAALVLFQKSFAITAISGDSLDRARLHNNMAVTLLFLGEHDRALEHFEKTLSGFTEAGDHAALGKTLNNIGDLYLRRGDLQSSRRSFEESLTFLEHSGNRYDRATVRGSLADVLTESGDTTAALPLYQETLAEFRALGDRKSQADTLIGLGEAHRKAGDAEKAVRHFLDALDIARLIGAAHQEIQALRHLGQAHFAAGRLDSAGEHLEAALSLAERTHDVDEKDRTESVLTEVRRAVGGTSTARTLPRHTFEPGGN
ncbi:tetratricopeptide repeat protein [Streptomyces asoensis]|uniref:Tetratricopeptide repeat protein n=1 Tax=Streptomyces asoensis TaxID=249586 RepID=A0A6M4WYB3_9ACTN|nr:tetratricopeptide repeat protein [Streptomyces asoensis]QJT05534.1 tetratricopeptide repeat protein [Streptomyces asoensis]